MMWRTLLLGGALLLVLTGLLWIARQPEPLSPGRAYVTDYGDGLHVYRQWRDGTGIRRMTRTPEGMAVGGRVAWSPDGRWLAYIDDGLHIVPAGGGTAISLTQRFNNVAPSWSPDGGSLTFQLFRERNWDIYVMDLQHIDAPRRLTTHPDIDSSPAWSPDGQWIAFASERAGSFDIFRMHPDGSGLKNLTNSGLLNEHSPVWSTDSAWIHFEVSRDRFERISVDGQTRRLVHGDTRDVIIPSRIPPVDLPLRFGGLVAAGVLTLFASGIISRWSQSIPGT